MVMARTTPAIVAWIPEESTAAQSRSPITAYAPGRRTPAMLAPTAKSTNAPAESNALHAIPPE
jgi:hypothetical protein